MNHDPNFFGTQSIHCSERGYDGSKYAEVREQLFRNRYYFVWGTTGDPPLPTYEVRLWQTLRGVFSRMWHFQDAANRTVDSQADMRWGADGKGFRRLLHPNGVCLFGKWKIDKAPAGKNYTGYFEPGKEALVIARYSTCCTETRRGHYRSLALVGNIYPTLNPDEKVRPVSFITQQDFGGEKTDYIEEAFLRNTPDTTPWRRGLGLPVLLVTGFVLFRADKRPTARQVYPIAELGKQSGPTHAPRFMQFKLAPDHLKIPGEQLDFRDEILGMIYDKGDPTPKRTLTFDIQVSDEGSRHGVLFERQPVSNWETIGQLSFTEAVASYNGDFVFHARHAPWRNDDDKPDTIARTRRPLF